MTERYRTEGGPSSMPGPADRFHWPSIVGGAFLALSLFVISTVLANAVGLDWTFRTARTTGQDVGTIIWGGIAALICFGLGSWLTVRTTVVSNRGYALINGLMVWAVAVPLLVYFLGASAGPMLGRAMEVGGEGAMQAGAHMGTAAGTASMSPAYVGHGQAAYWWMLVSLGLGLIASLIIGYSAGRTGHERGYGSTAGT